MKADAWVITYDPPPIPLRLYDWKWRHDEYDGAPDAHDSRYGREASYEACVEAIREVLRGAREEAVSERYRYSAEEGVVADNRDTVAGRLRRWIKRRESIGGGDYEAMVGEEVETLLAFAEEAAREFIEIQEAGTDSGEQGEFETCALCGEATGWCDPKCEIGKKVARARELGLEEP